MIKTSEPIETGRPDKKEDGWTDTIINMQQRQEYSAYENRSGKRQGGIKTC